MKREPTKFDQELGALIQLHRTACGMSLDELSSRTNLPKGLLASYEAEGIGIPVKRFCVIMGALDQDPAQALTHLQQRLALSVAQPEQVSTGKSFIASIRGRQIINALAMCDQPKALDALADLILAIGVHSCVKSHKSALPPQPLDQSEQP